MAYINGVSYTNYNAINLTGKNGVNGGLLRFTPMLVQPTSATTEKLLYVFGSSLYYDNGSGATLINGGGAGGTPSWETIYAADSTFAIAAGTWTITQSSANALLTLSKTNVGAGAVISIANSGTGVDIGNSTTWGISVAGGVGVVELSSGGTINATGGALTIGSAGTTTTFSGAVTITQNVTISGSSTFATGTGAVTLAGAVTVSSGKSLTLAGGQVGITSTSNTVAAIAAVNNTLTTFGVGGTSTGMVVISSTSITSGALLRLQAAEGTITGSYLSCWDSAGGAAVLSVGIAGATVIAGAAVATASLTQTKGDHVISDGNVSQTTSGNAAGNGFALTANSATGNTVFLVTGSAAFTGNTTSSFARIVASGLTTGTVLSMPAVALTTGSVIVTSANAITTGKFFTLSSTSATLTSAKFIDITWNPATYTGAGVTTAGLVAISDSPTVSTTVGGTHNDLNVTRTNTTAAAAITYSPSGSIVKIVNAAPTVGAGSTLTDSAVVLDIQQNNTAASVGAAATFLSLAGAGGSQLATFVADSVTTSTSGVVSISAAALTTGFALKISSTGTGITSGGLINASSGTTGLLATNGVVNFTATGAYTTNVGISFFAVVANSSVTGDVASYSGTALTTGSVLTAGSSGTGMTTGSCFKVRSGTTAAVATNGIVALIATGNYSSTGNVGLLNTVADSTTAGTVARFSGAALTSGILALFDQGAGVYTGTGAVTVTGSGITTGIALLVSNSGVMTGNGQIAQFTAAGAVDNTKVFGITANAVTTGSLLNISGTGMTTGVAVKVTATAATLTTGAYFQANDGGVNVFAVGLNGHLQSRATSKPTIAVSQQNGITAAAVTAGSTDTCGIVTTTGTNNNGGTSIIVVTFNKAYAVAPVVVISGANASGSLIWPNVASATTTFTITVPASGSSGATPSWNYQVIEMGT